jgi:hypothetical protein
MLCGPSTGVNTLKEKMIAAAHALRFIYASKTSRGIEQKRAALQISCAVRIFKPRA